MSRLLRAGAAVALVVATSNSGGGVAMAAPAEATVCGVGLVAGLALCIDWHMKRSEFAALVAKARAGDNQAADRLGDFFLVMGDPQSERMAMRWWRLAAHRGHCSSIVKMGGAAERPRETRRWKIEAKRRACGAPTFQLR